jgi:hypothetical protein
MWVCYNCYTICGFVTIVTQYVGLLQLSQVLQLLHNMWVCYNLFNEVLSSLRLPIFFSVIERICNYLLISN